MVLNVFFHRARDTELAYDRLLHNLSGISERSAISIPFQILSVYIGNTLLSFYNVYGV